MGKGGKPTVGFRYRVAFHHGITIGPIDAFLEFRGGDKTAWQGQLTASGTLSINAPSLWGGDKDQGGIVGDVDVMFGEATQLPNPYLVSVFGVQTTAWRGFTTLAFKGGRYGAMNPYPQKPSYKFRRIKQGWDSGTCWYPAKAEIPFAATSSTTGGLFHVAASAVVENSGVVFGPWPLGDFVGTADAIARACIAVRPGGWQFLTSFWDGTAIGSTSVALGINVGIAGVLATPLCPTGYTAQVEAGSTGGVGLQTPAVVCLLNTSSLGINPAHVLYESRTNAEMGREPTANINDASLQAAADKLYAENFGICPKWDPAGESVEDFEKRICKLIGGSFTRSLEDGQWYLDLARGDYVLADLPILTDDDILDFKEQPSILDNAVNSVSVSYVDPDKNETIVTAPVRAMGLVASFGTIHQTNNYPEIPSADLAARIALRDLLTTATPTRAFDLVTTRRTYAWRPNQYFRLQLPKRGIADMVCLVADKQAGTLKSGAIRMKAAQDIYSLPATSFVQVEPGVDTRPPQTPTAITLQRAFEAPYIEIASALSRADLAALPNDVSYAMATAATAASDIDYTMMVAADGVDYAEVAHSGWCATATVNETAARGDINFTLANASGLGAVVTGMPALWDDEIVRVDAIDVAAGTITLARGCADTAPAPAGHAAGSRLWFYTTAAARGTTEYTAAETVNVRLLSNTGSQQLPLALATTMPLTFASRQVRPYPPGNLKINGSSTPGTLTGAINVTWSHRDRVLQADQLVDTLQTDIGPEPGTTYTVSVYVGGVLNAVVAGVAGTSATPVITAGGAVDLRVTASRAGFESWQALACSFTYTAPAGSGRLTQAGDFRITAAGDRRITG